MSKAVSLLFVHKTGFFGRAISFITRKRVNHVAVRIGDIVYEMLFNAFDEKLPDMCSWEYKQYTLSNEFEEIEIPIDYIDATIFHFKNKDKHYDVWRSLFWLLRFVTQWNTRSEWNCVEHAYQFLIQHKHTDVWNGSNIDPGTLYTIIKKKFPIC